MLETLPEPIRLEGGSSRTQGRKRRLNQGIDDWIKSTLASWRAPHSAQRSTAQNGSSRRAAAPALLNRAKAPLEPSPRAPGAPPKSRRIRRGGVALILLTAQPDMQTAYGAARRFWQELRERYGELTYFCWLELTADGKPHYHAMLVNPPPGFFGRENRPFLEQAWGNRYVKLQWRDASWFRDQGGRYVGGYAKKFGQKSYQQSYEDVPRELRTFMSNRLAHPAALRAEYRDKGVVEPVIPNWCGVRGFQPQPELALVGWYRHPGDSCVLPYVTKQQGVMQAVAQRKPLRARFVHGLLPAGVSRSKDRLGAYAPVAAGPSPHARAAGDDVERSTIEEVFTGSHAPPRLSETACAEHKDTPAASTLQGQAAGVSRKQASCLPAS